MSEIETFADRTTAAEAAAEIIAGALTEAVRERGRGNFVATGGSSPSTVYWRMSQMALPWDQINVTLSDDRWVEPDHTESNEGLVRARLAAGFDAGARFTPLKIPGAATPALSAQAAEAGISWLTPFDVTLLGMGEDGHIASLFPGSPALAEGMNPSTRRLVIDVPAGDPAPSRPRLSLTLPALLATRLIIVLGFGEAKRRMIEAGRARPIHALLRQDRTPVRLIWSPE